jgi:hypothetical protein
MIISKQRISICRFNELAKGRKTSKPKSQIKKAAIKFFEILVPNSLSVSEKLLISFWFKFNFFIYNLIFHKKNKKFGI